MPNFGEHPLQQWVVDQYNVLKYDLAFPFLGRKLVPAFLNYVRRCWGASTWEVHPDTQTLLDKKEPVIFAIWHGQMFSLVHPKWVESLHSHEEREALPSYVLISQSRDGDFIATVAEHIGFPHHVRGAYGRGGSKAVTEIQDLLTQKKGNLICLMDGPKGPKHQVKKGIVKLAQQLQVPIVPLAAVTPHHWFKFTSAWDDFEIPNIAFPIHVSLGAPILITEAGEKASTLKGINKTLMAHLKATWALHPKNKHNH